MKKITFLRPCCINNIFIHLIFQKGSKKARRGSQAKVESEEEEEVDKEVEEEGEEEPSAEEKESSNDVSLNVT